MGREKDQSSRRRTSGGGYRHPIPSRDEILRTLERDRAPQPLAALAEELGVGDEQMRGLENRLKAMVRDGQLIRNRARAYCLTGHLDLVTGVVTAPNRDGYGFLRPDGDGDDIYLSANEMRPLWEGDRIAVRVNETRRGPSGHVVEILERAKTEIVGTLHRERGVDFVIEAGETKAEVLIGRGHRGGAKPGDVVRVKVLEHPTQRTAAIGEVVALVGRADESGIETDVAILAHGLPYEWSTDVLEQVRGVPDAVPAHAKRGREDLRSLPLVTIDGADARDFDDAVFCEPNGDGWRLIVAIADVGHYVEQGTALDREARQRGTSVYFPDRVIPMLPEALSNGLCSLNPKVDRLCMACEMQVTRQGKVTRSRFSNAVMRSSARLTYTQAWQLLTQKPRSKHDASLRRTLEPLQAVYRAFAGARRRRGAIDFEFPETKIELDDQGRVATMHVVERLETHRIIEECMIAANVEAAKRVLKGRIPSLFRVHEGPDSDKIDELFLFLRTFDVRLPPPDNVKPGDFSRLIDALATRPEAELIKTMILRAMKQAQYQPRNVGHFGLALASYAHFTSPIRRYPDLLVHRAIKWLLEHSSFKGFGYSIGEMVKLGEHTSRTERRADEAVWDVEEQLKCAYMRERVGESFDALVSSVVPFGMFVRIPDLGIDGLVHVSTLPRDYYHREPSGAALVGERTGQRYALMDRMRVRLTNVNLEERKIDFVPDEASLEAAPEDDRARRGRRDGARRRGRRRERRRG